VEEAQVRQETLETLSCQRGNIAVSFTIYNVESSAVTARPMQQIFPLNIFPYFAKQSSCMARDSWNTPYNPNCITRLTTYINHGSNYRTSWRAFCTISRPNPTGLKISDMICPLRFLATLHFHEWLLVRLLHYSMLLQIRRQNVFIILSPLADYIYLYLVPPFVVNKWQVKVIAVL
jgi:hypothetical protein